MTERSPPCIIVNMIVDHLRNLVEASRVLTGKAVEYACRDESGLGEVAPLAVVQAADEKEVQRVITFCFERKIPVTARGAGSALEGSTIPVKGGIVLDLSRMDRVIEVSTEERFCRVQPGVVYDTLNKQLSKYGLFFPPSPGGSSDVATIGGMVATNASGIYAYRYGGTGSWVKTLRVITGKGELLELGSRVPKSSVGYDLVHLFVGSEGTLGIITEVGLGLAPLPEERVKVAYRFDGFKEAVDAAVEFSWGVPMLAAVEFLDADTIQSISEFLGRPIIPGYYLFLEFHGETKVPDDVLELAHEVAETHKGSRLDVKEPWYLRHFGTRAVQRLGRALIRTDAAVPVSRLPEYLNWAKDQKGLRVFAFGHIGLGIVHLLVPYDPEDQGLVNKVHEFKKKAGLKALSLGGTISGEHGVGTGNRELARLQLGMAYNLMSRIKELLDPHGIMNPGKVF